MPLREIVCNLAKAQGKKEDIINHTRIEWVKNEDGTQGFSINPVKGKCPVACPYCYARRLYDRFKWNPKIRLDSTVFAPLDGLKPSSVFVGSTFELFGDWVKPEWMKFIFERVRLFKEHTFIFLTKKPEELLRWSPFPPNTYIGVSVTNQEMHNRAIACLAGIKASIKFISYEPLLSEIDFNGAYDLSEIQWVIIGTQTPYSVKTAPKKEWIDDIVDAADKAGIPVFLKENLRPVLKSVVGDLPMRQGVS